MGQKARQLATFSNGLHKTGAGGELENGVQLQEVGAAPKFQMKSQTAKNCRTFLCVLALFSGYSFCSARASFVFNLCSAHLMFATATPTSLTKSRADRRGIRGVSWGKCLRFRLYFYLAKTPGELAKWRAGKMAKWLHRRQRKTSVKLAP